jgi:hypothetical protein
VQSVRKFSPVFRPAVVQEFWEMILDKKKKISSKNFTESATMGHNKGVLKQKIKFIAFLC